MTVPCDSRPLIQFTAQSSLHGKRPFRKVPGTRYLLPLQDFPAPAVLSSGYAGFFTGTPVAYTFFTVNVLFCFILHQELKVHGEDLGIARS